MSSKYSYIVFHITSDNIKFNRGIYSSKQIANKHAIELFNNYSIGAKEEDVVSTIGEDGLFIGLKGNQTILVVEIK